MFSAHLSHGKFWSAIHAEATNGSSTTTSGLGPAPTFSLKKLDHAIQMKSNFVISPGSCCCRVCRHSLSLAVKYWWRKAHNRSGSGILGTNRLALKSEQGSSRYPSLGYQGVFMHTTPTNVKVSFGRSRFSTWLRPNGSRLNFIGKIKASHGFFPLAEFLCSFTTNGHYRE